MRLFQKNPKEIDTESLNQVIHLSEKILKILFIILIIVGTYAVTLILKEWKIGIFLLTVLKVISPLFIGLFIAWLFDPFVTWMKQKGIRRSLGTFITYLLLLGGIYILLSTIFPMLFSQINDFAKAIPLILDNVQNWIGGLIDNFKNVDGFNTVQFKKELFAQLENFGSDLTTDLPGTIVTFMQAFISGLGNFFVGLVIGFYLLMGYDKIHIVDYLPNHLKKDGNVLIRKMNTSLRSYIQGALLDCTAIFLITSLGLSLTGLQAPLLFGLFCGITNVIPYAGPYIGGAPAVVVGFSQSPTIGFLTLLVIALIQLIEGNFFQPMIMSKTTKLHPVTIIVGLIVFGHFWGILGMLISTPIIAMIKTIFLYFDQKYAIIRTYQESEEKD